MVTAVYFYADAHDTAELLDFFRYGDEVSLHPWPLVREPALSYTPEEAVRDGTVMLRSNRFSAPVILRDGDSAFTSPARAAVFNQINRERLNPSAENGWLVDSNLSPVLLWNPGQSTSTELRTSSIGSQADSMRSVSADYERWVNRVMSWIRRRGTAVWGLDRSNVRPDLDIDLEFLNSVYALPSALRRLEEGAAGR
ncbi:MULTISPECIES: hypothetical protein [unclassified Cryobacterium]|uniref:hypothetical protein n=1 Tax=unclassified Cryobacterium TaxID=2649013 RepID=UPI00106A32DD|nr:MULTISPECIES: hypothetical protein [unclassified Cryobacterium]TFC54548.1 hypothetical protein E3O68_09405 [Cryobacterium sp. TMB3-1-2]TFC70870.1 hypothetical protein E3T21_09225 [Cryobacterium sp. TMB3-15]TFC77323.1 hypothetical protein E3T22_06345 [Cryobacterium sp. TMB3-10]TFD45257.1 hypothetical protein E3T58_02970 [Cryobacterium sp. TMB3-12]